ncbi:hypothetical protein [uncultured Eubacterium sp.]|uniref:hypothetical protein n=1 Tax=uncultured Eubacterium sp. TaxID=165185 RepID=UPI0025925BDC|nr:hypothetical protein [uncultured Eubacterium sp.]
MKMGKFGEAVLLLVMVCIIVVSPSLMIWKFHIMSVSDPSVLFGIIVVYAFGAVAAGYGIYFLKNAIAEKKDKHVIDIRHSRYVNN